MMIVRLNRRRRFSAQWLSFVIVSHSSWLFRLWFVFALSRSYHRMICADFRTIKSFFRKISKWSSLFVKWSQNDHVFSDRTFWIFSHFWNFLFRAQFVRAKVTLSSDRKYYKKDVMMMIKRNHDDQWKWWSIFFHETKECSLCAFFRFHDSSSSNSFDFTMIIISCLSR
jgi:hypothetical protein